MSNYQAEYISDWINIIDLSQKYNLDVDVVVKVMEENYMQ